MGQSNPGFTFLLQGNAGVSGEKIFSIDLGEKEQDGSAALGLLRDV